MQKNNYMISDTFVINCKESKTCPKKTFIWEYNFLQNLQLSQVMMEENYENNMIKDKTYMITVSDVLK